MGFSSQAKIYALHIKLKISTREVDVVHYE